MIEELCNLILAQQREIESLRQKIELMKRYIEVYEEYIKGEWIQNGNQN